IAVRNSLRLLPSISLQECVTAMPINVAAILIIRKDTLSAPLVTYRQRRLPVPTKDWGIV
ncbi:MAG: hypothetical protein WB509_10380, partial [Acetobacteraceae bacterium]